MVADGAPTSEGELLKGLRAGDARAYRLFVERNSADVYNVALKLLGDEHEAEDVLQETFLSAFKAIRGFEGRSQLSTWLYRIAYNASLMRLRKRKQMTTFSLDQPPGCCLLHARLYPIICLLFLPLVVTVHLNLLVLSGRLFCLDFETSAAFTHCTGEGSLESPTRRDGNRRVEGGVRDWYSVRWGIIVI